MGDTTIESVHFIALTRCCKWSGMKRVWWNNTALLNFNNQNTKIVSVVLKGLCQSAFSPSILFPTVLHLRGLKKKTMRTLRKTLKKKRDIKRSDELDVNYGIKTENPTLNSEKSTHDVKHMTIRRRSRWWVKITDGQ